MGKNEINKQLVSYKQKEKEKLFHDKKLFFLNYKAFLGLNSQFGKHRIQMSGLYGYSIINDFMSEDGIHYTEIPRIPTFDLRAEYNNRWLFFPYLRYLFPLSYFSDRYFE